MVLVAFWGLWGMFAFIGSFILSSLFFYICLFVFSAHLMQRMTLTRLLFPNWFISSFDFQTCKRCSICCCGCTCLWTLVATFPCVCVFVVLWLLCSCLCRWMLTMQYLGYPSTYSRVVYMHFFVLQVKVAILKYIDTLTLQMEAPDFVNSSETRLAISRIITWTTEPKSSDVRKVPTHKPPPAHNIILMILERTTTAFDSWMHTQEDRDFKSFWLRDVFCVLQAAQSVLISLFQLNTPEFTMLLAALPKTFQDGATKLLQNHLKNTGNAAQVTKRAFQTHMARFGCESL